MNGSDKAAIFLHFIGPDATSKVFEHLEDEEIKKIGQSMTGLGHVTRPVIDRVVQEYTGMMDPASGFFSQGEEFVKKVLEKTFGPQKAEILLLELYTSHGEMVDILANMDGKTIANFLSQEHPQTIAVVLAKLKPKQSGEVIAHLPQELQADVVMRIADVDQVSPEILAEIDDVIKREFNGITAFEIQLDDNEMFNTLISLAGRNTPGRGMTAGAGDAGRTVKRPRP